MEQKTGKTLKEVILKRSLAKSEKNAISSSSARTALVQKIREVIDRGDDIGINVDGKEVVVLTLTEPYRGTPALKITTLEATHGWSELLSFISVMGACFYFKLKPIDDQKEVPRVYLVRGEFRNRFQTPWKEHKRKWTEQQPNQNVTQQEKDEAQSEKLDDLLEKFSEFGESLATLRRQFLVSVASQNRNGDIYRTPEFGLVPLRNASNLPNPHCGD